MRLLRRNTTEFEYLPLVEMEETDEDGDPTGEFTQVFGDPIRYRGNISTPNGQTTQQFYGEDIRYTHTLVMDKPNAEISETGVVRWKENLYEIKAVRPSLNVLSIALRRLGPEEEVPNGTGGDGE